MERFLALRVFSTYHPPTLRCGEATPAPEVVGKSGDFLLFSDTFLYFSNFVVVMMKLDNTSIKKSFDWERPFMGGLVQAVLYTTPAYWLPGIKLGKDDKDANRFLREDLTDMTADFTPTQCRIQGASMVAGAAMGLSLDFVLLDTAYKAIWLISDYVMK
jgi:hypothetical protein